MKQEIRIHIAGMIYNQSMGGTYSLVLMEHEGLKRRFSVLIGEAEAQSIALHLNKTKAPRPLSHDLMHTLVNELNAQVIKVVIYKMTNDIFYSEIHLIQGDRQFTIDSRTSDAIALAVRSESPIFINSEILDIVGAEIDEDGEITNKPRETGSESVSEKQLDKMDIDGLKKLDIKELEELLERSLEVENYEVAALIRDEIDLRK